MNRDYLDQAKADAATLLAASTKQDEKILWSTAKVDQQKLIVRQLDYSLESGSLRIIFFFCELYQLTKDRQYLDAATKGINGIEHQLHVEPSNNFGLYTGKMGLVGCYLLLYTITGNEDYADRGFQLAMESKSFVDAIDTNNSLYEGRAGILVMLLNLYEIRTVPPVRELIVLTTNKILEAACYTSHGIQWHFSATQTSIVNSFGYGTSGIGFALDILSKKTNLSWLNSIVAQVYENYQRGWNHRIKGWYDHRLIIDTPKKDRALLSAFREKKQSSALLRGFVNRSFDSGDAGILYSTLHYLSDKKLTARWKKIINETWLELAEGLSTQQGLEAGLALSYLSPFINDKQRKLVTEKLRTSKPDSLIAKDIRLFSMENGLARRGINNLLRSNPGIAKDVFQRFFIFSDKVTLDLAGESLQFLPHMKYFARTSHLLNEVSGNAYFDGLEKDRFNRKEFVKNIKTRVKQYKHKNSMIADCFKLELRRYEIMNENTSSVVYFVRKYQWFLENRRLQRLSDSNLLKQRYQLNQCATIITSNYDVRAANIGAHKKDRQVSQEVNYTLLMPVDTREEVREKVLSDFAELLINFEYPLSGIQLIRKLTEMLDVQITQDVIREKVVNLLLEYVQAGVLVVRPGR